MSTHGCRISDAFYSNCLFTALSAKLHDWKNVTVHFVPHKYQHARGCHFYWTRKDEPDTFYDFTHTKEQRWMLWAKGFIRRHTREEHDTYRNFGLLKRAKALAKKYDFKVWQKEYYDLDHKLYFLPVKNNAVFCSDLRDYEYRIVGKVYDKDGDVYIKVFECLPSGEIINPKKENIEEWHGFDNRVNAELLNECWGNSCQIWSILHTRAYLRNTILEYTAEDKRSELETLFGSYGINSQEEISAVTKEAEAIYTAVKKSEYTGFVYEEQVFDELRYDFNMHVGDNVQKIINEWNTTYKCDVAPYDVYNYFTEAADKALAYRKRIREVFLVLTEDGKKQQVENFFEQNSYGTMTEEEKHHVIKLLCANRSDLDKDFYSEQLLCGGVLVSALRNPSVDCAKAMEEIHGHDYREAAIIRGALHE